MTTLRAIGLFVALLFGVAPAHAARPLLEETRSVALEVDDPERVANQLERFAKEFGGELAQRSGETVTLRLPPTGVEAAVERLRAYGRLTVGRTETRDVTLKRAELAAGLTGVEASRADLVELRGLARNTDDGLAVEREIQRQDAAIAQLRRRLAELDRRTRGVLVTVRLVRTHEVETVPRPELPFEWLGQLSLPALMSGHGVRPPRRHIDTNVDIATLFEVHQLAGADGREDSTAGAFGVHFRGAKTDPVGFAGGTDAVFGGGEGFLYEVALLGGLGVSLGSVSTVGIIGGVGLSGWTPKRRVPVALDLPVELFFTVDAGEVLRLKGYAQSRFEVPETRRNDGSKTAWIADELRFGGSVTVPALLGNDELEESGLRLGFSYREQVDTELYVFTLGIAAGIVDVDSY